MVSVFLLGYVLGNPNSTGGGGAVADAAVHADHYVYADLRADAAVVADWLSIALLAGSVGAMVWLAARIYRVGVLMYGKRATLPEMIRWLRYS